MLTWCAILFGLGVVAFLDSIFNYGEIFRRVNSVLFLLTSLGLLVRTSMKMKIRYVERLEERLQELEGIPADQAINKNLQNHPFKKKKQTVS